MTKQTAIRIHVEVGADHTIRLPDEVPLGPAEVIVLTPGAVTGAPPPEALGLFKDSPELVDQAMAHVAEMRSRSKIRPAK
jgi:hypothetical protein